MLLEQFFKGPAGLVPVFSVLLILVLFVPGSAVKPLKVAPVKKRYSSCVYPIIYCTVTCSVAEPEPVERPLFGGTGAGAQVFRPGSGSGYVNSYKMLQKVLKFSYKI
jgi:hypothetical protein